jgi:hypothetical protein
MELSYYKTNAVYDLLSKEQKHPFVWVSGNAWMLIYGDQMVTPKVLVLAFGKSWTKQKEIIKTMEIIAARSEIPLFFVKFDDEAESIEKVLFGSPGQQPAELTLDELKNEFQKIGLPVENGTCGKSVNDATSSAYHKWQRDNLGSIIKVTDIDLVRLDSDGEPIEVIELKRSFYSFDQWNPYSKDYVNFNLLLSVCKPAAMTVTIAYNVRQTEPFFKDDASQLLLFSYSTQNTPVKIGKFSYNDFLAGSY